MKDSHLIAQALGGMAREGGPGGVPKGEDIQSIDTDH